MATDAEIRAKGFLYIPKQKYLQNPFNLPIAPVPPATPPGGGGITNTNAFTGGDNDGFSVYNPDPNSIVNRNANSTRYNDLVDSKIVRAGGTYPGNFQSNEGGFEYTNSFPNNSIQMENLNNSYLNQGNTFQGERFNTNIQDEKDMIAEMAAEGIAPGDPYTYNNNRFSTIDGQNNIFDVDVRGDPALNPGSKMVEGNDPYGEKAFEEEEGKKGIAGLIEKYLTNSFVGKGINAAGNFLNDVLPTNKRAMLENQLGARGVMVNDIGQIVQGEGSYDDASGRNVMAGYNANKMTAETFDKRIAMATDKMKPGKYKDDRLAALEAAKEDFLKSQNESDFMYDETEEEKNKKKKKGNIITRFLTKKKDAKVAQEAQEAQEAQDAKDATAANALRFKQEQDRLAGLVGTRVTDRNTGTSSIVQTESGGNDRGTSRPSDHSQSVGLGSNAGNVRSANRAGTGSAQSYNQNLAYGGRAGYFFGGRVNYKIGGRVGFKNGGLASIL